MMRFKIFLALFFLAALAGCGSKENSASGIQGIQDLKTKQYAIHGKVLYDNLCANCHQADGSGLGRVIPPLAGSDYMQEDIGRTIRIIKFGLDGEIVVNGITYNQPMPPNPHLTNLEISEIATYIYNVWGNREGLIPVETVTKSLKQE
jgi:cytochrome c551